MKLLSKVSKLLTLPVIIVAVFVIVVLMNFKNKFDNEVADVAHHADDDAQNWPVDPNNVVDLGMYDIENPNAFGTTKEEDRRITNDGVRREYNVNPFPWAEDVCGVDCAKHGVPDPGIGQTHSCSSGPPSKRIVDMYGSHFQLNHICSVSGGPCSDEPSVLGRFWCRKGCSNPESVGLNVRPICTRCK